MKAGTATKIILNTISTAAMVKVGKVYGNLMVDMQVTCQKLQDRGERILMDTLGVKREEASRLLDAVGRACEDRDRDVQAVARLPTKRVTGWRLMGGSIADVVGDLRIG